MRGRAIPGPMAGSVIALTGASSGLGAAVAERFGRDGARLGLMARRTAELEAVADRVRDAGGEARVFALDVCDSEAVATAVGELVEAFGPVDLAIANAGIGGPFPLDTFDAAAFARLMRVNVEGAANLFAATVPAMIERKSGHVVGVSSLAAFRGLPGSGPYSASKAALSTMLESMRLDLKPHGVGVTAVHPGFVRTPLTDTNDFPMPFRMEVEDAADLFVRRLARQPRELNFPLPLVAAMRLAQWLPAPLFELFFSSTGLKAGK